MTADDIKSFTSKTLLKKDTAPTLEPRIQHGGREMIDQSSSYAFVWNASTQSAHIHNANLQTRQNRFIRFDQTGAADLQGSAAPFVVLRTAIAKRRPGPRPGSNVPLKTTEGHRWSKRLQTSTPKNLNPLKNRSGQCVAATHGRVDCFRTHSRCNASAVSERARKTDITTPVTFNKAASFWPCLSLGGMTVTAHGFPSQGKPCRHPGRTTVTTASKQARGCPMKPRDIDLKVEQDRMKRDKTARWLMDHDDGRPPPQKRKPKMRRSRKRWQRQRLDQIAKQERAYRARKNMNPR